VNNERAIRIAGWALLAAAITFILLCSGCRAPDRHKDLRERIGGL